MKESPLAKKKSKNDAADHVAKKDEQLLEDGEVLNQETEQNEEEQ